VYINRDVSLTHSDYWDRFESLEYREYQERVREPFCSNDDVIDTHIHTNNNVHTHTKFGDNNYVNDVDHNNNNNNNKKYMKLTLRQKEEMLRRHNTTDKHHNINNNTHNNNYKQSNNKKKKINNNNNNTHTQQEQPIKSTQTYIHTHIHTDACISTHF